jgi:hypothetical protein
LQNQNKNNKTTTKEFVYELENHLNKSKGKTTMGQPNSRNHYTKMHITNIRNTHKPLASSKLCKINKPLARLLASQSSWSAFPYCPTNRLLYGFESEGCDLNLNKIPKQAKA